MVLLARLAVAHGRQGQGLGRDLLIEAIEQAATAGQHATARFIAVDPIDEHARSFYAAFGFQPSRGTPTAGCTCASTRRSQRSAAHHPELPT